jgi:hypothetical protein
VEFARSHFLVREGVRFNRKGNSNPILQIDRIDKTAKRWKKADVLVFNTGHWWTHGKTARGYATLGFLNVRFCHFLAGSICILLQMMYYLNLKAQKELLQRRG